MAIYVDNAKIPAKVGKHKSLWSHLFCAPDNEQELIEFIKKLGLQPKYIQRGTYTHFDVTENKRKEAIKLGANPVSWRDAIKLLQKDREGKSSEKKPRKRSRKKKVQDTKCDGGSLP